MRSRIWVIAALLVGGFVFATTYKRWGPLVARGPAAEGPMWSGPQVVRGSGFGADEQNNIEVYRKAHEATVNITSIVYRQDWIFRYPVQGTGSGFFIDKQGRILTNNHVVSGRAPELMVTLANGKKYKAEIVYRDPANDLAMIRINPKDDIKILALGDSDKLQVGQKVLAIGNPFGLEGTLTTGIISSLGREIGDESGQRLEGMIQTDAAINRGNSGGPLLDSVGNVIGINTAILGEANIGIGFALPINRAKTMIEDYQANRQYGRPRLGVQTVYIHGDLAVELGLPEEGGLLIQGVAQGSAAEQAGLREPRRILVIGNSEIGIGGDLIMAIDGQRVDRQDALARLLSKRRPGDKVELTLYRNGRRVNVTVTLGRASENP